MNKKIKKYQIVILILLMIIGISIPTMPYVEAASNQLLIINTRTNKMGYFVNNKLVKEFAVATGKASTPTPTGKSVIVNKIINRPYYKLGIPGGSPRNPLGNRWLGLKIRGTYGSTYAIHGNNNESSIGKHISGGCIRMHNSEVRWLFDRIPKYSVVILKNTNQSYKQIAAGYGINLNDSDKPTPPIKKGWQTINGKKYYYNEQGKKVTGWQVINKNKYYFNKEGVMQTNWQVINKNKYYFNKEGAMQTNWQVINKNKYYFNKEGVMQTNWQVINKNKYYFNKEGAMQTGWQVINKNKYYFNKEGAMQTGWQVINKNKYYFNKEGVMQTGWQVINKNKYYFNKEGVMQTGWQVINKNKYYFNKEGAMQTGWQVINKNKYYFNKEGVMQTGWQEINGNKYYFNKDGVMQTGWQEIDGKKYYFYEDGKMAINTEIDGVTLGPDGVAITE
ncbi:L,D-transpeptidase [Romboutsia sp.]|uniref:L,D-transpeptidase n=1 Tax=Romboutsia sp. TaxID=1965302 RepID=UPI003F381D84